MMVVGVDQFKDLFQPEPNQLPSSAKSEPELEPENLMAEPEPVPEPNCWYVVGFWYLVMTYEYKIFKQLE